MNAKVKYFNRNARAVDLLLMTAHSSLSANNEGNAMKYVEAEAIIINKRENDFRNDVVIFAEQIAGDDALNAALLRFYCETNSYAIEIAHNDLNNELERIETYYATHNIDEEVGLFLIDNGGRKDELGLWL